MTKMQDVEFGDEVMLRPKMAKGSPNELIIRLTVMGKKQEAVDWKNRQPVIRHAISGTMTVGDSHSGFGTYGVQHSGWFSESDWECEKIERL